MVQNLNFLTVSMTQLENSTTSYSRSQMNFRDTVNSV